MPNMQDKNTSVMLPHSRKEVTSLGVIRRKAEWAKPGLAFAIINEELASAARHLLRFPTNHPWAILGPAIQAAVDRSRIVAGPDVTHKVLIAMGLEKYNT